MDFFQKPHYFLHFLQPDFYPDRAGPSMVVTTSGQGRGRVGPGVLGGCRPLVPVACGGTITCQKLGQRRVSPKERKQPSSPPRSHRLPAYRRLQLRGWESRSSRQIHPPRCPPLVLLQL